MAKRKRITKVRSSGVFEQKPVEELLEIFKELRPGHDVKFKDKEQLVRALILELGNKLPPGRRRREVRMRSTAEPLDRKPMLFDPTRREIKDPMPHTKRERLVSLLRIGVTFGTVMSEFGWTYAQTLSYMRAVNTLHGYGFWEKDKRIYIYTYDEGPPT